MDTSIPGRRLPASGATDRTPSGFAPFVAGLPWGQRLVLAEFAALAVLGLASLAVPAGSPVGHRATAVSAFILLLATGSASAAAWMAAHRADTGFRAKWLAAAFSATAATQVGVIVWDLVAGHIPASTGFDLTAALLLVAFLGLVAIDLVAHRRGRASELVSDLALMAVLSGAAVFLLLHRHPVDDEFWALGKTAGMVIGAVLLLASAGVLTVWSPSRVHAWRFACSVLLSASAIGIVYTRELGSTGRTLASLQVLAELAVLGLASLLVVAPSLDDRDRARARPDWIRPALLALSFCWMSALFLLASADRELGLTVAEIAVVGAVVLSALGIRTVLSQIGAIRSARDLEIALADREAALAEKEAAIGSLRRAVEVVAASEARLRLLLGSAVDGIVELDASGMIVNANGAFSSMVRIPLERVVGQTWDDLAALVEPGGEALATLAETGEAALVTQVGTIHLEARRSPMPTDPPGQLLLIRDVSQARVADQTIRTLFQFLQDKDEDRTNLLKRSNSAIEAERNRIARDLHDGPIQGITGAALSLEAVRLMLEAGDERAGDMLAAICTELSEEAINLRRIMKDLRPPVLEQRGLVPAVRELCDRASREMDIRVRIIAGEVHDISSDIETLAYRVVQEALTNVGKHARATSVGVRIEAMQGTLEVEISDDGRGFDPKRIREFLQEGKVGLASMRERAELAGGTLIVRSQPDKGTIVAATLPFELLARAATG